MLSGEIEQEVGMSQRDIRVEDHSRVQAAQVTKLPLLVLALGSRERGFEQFVGARAPS
ncbi:MAG: hypothetical protein ACRDL4_06540 [Thermoleophilaceae bacterium]